MPPKRPGEADGAGGSGQNGAAKKPRTSAPGSTATPALSTIQAQIEAAKAKTAALAASLSQGRAATATGATPASSRIPQKPQPASSGAGLDIAAMQRQIAEARKRTDQMASGTLGKLQQQRNDGAKGGGIHPLLMNAGSSSALHASRAPKFSSISANARGSPLLSTLGVGVKEESANPYLSAEGTEAERGRGRNMHRSLQFHKPGRHVREAEEARREAQMEALKKRIQESAKKAGMDELSAEERALRRNAPPDVEWWDQALLPGKTYEVVDVLGKGKAKEREVGILIEGEDSPIDIYVQHPIPIPAPSDKIKVEPKGVMLTKKEMKKMRKQRRLADQEDKRDKIKMGLLPPDPPKVKLSNLMKVLTSEAVADPTKVEAQVRREVAARKEIHDQTNLDNQLTPEQRRAKIEARKEKDASKGVYTLVFKIRHLVSPSHKFKVRKNAMQYGLTGMAIFEKNFALVVVEGGHKSIKDYRRLMTVRINWNDPGRPKADAIDDLPDLDAGASTSTAEKSKEEDEMSKIDWSENYCKIIFEGPVRESHFRYGFKAHYCDHESGAKEALGPKLASFWDLAKRFDMANEE